MHIISCKATEIKDTRGRPTVKVKVAARITEGVGGLPPLPGREKAGVRVVEVRAIASVPSGKSTGSHEAKELRDADGNGVSRALELLNGEVSALIYSREFSTLRELDEALLVLDGTPDKSRLGSNGILAVSIAAARLFAKERGVPLWKYLAEESNSTPTAPRLFANVINGGAHADFRLPFQEYMVVCGGEGQEVEQSFSALSELYKELRGVLAHECGEEVSMGDEGGYSPTFSTIEKPFEILAKLIEGKPGLSLAIDAAASELLVPGEKETYKLLDRTYSRIDLLALYANLTQAFPLASIEDPFAEDDREGFRNITAQFTKVKPMSNIGFTFVNLIVADDLTVTNPARIAAAAQEKLANAVIVKPNQIGSVTETLAAVRVARENGWKIIVSHRSGETNDTFIADLAYGLGAHGIKAGGLAQKERLEKYHRLLEIEREATI